MACPIEDSIKVNWDAVVGRHKMKMDIRVIIWDCKGEVLATLFAPKDHIIELSIVEAIVALRATHFCIELGGPPTGVAERWHSPSCAIFEERRQELQ